MTVNNVFEDWACDAAPSVPLARTGETRVRMGGFCFTESGICLDVSEVEVQAMQHPPIGPYTSGESS